MKNEKRTILVCIHGNSSSSKVFEKLKKIESKDIEIFDLDLPGHGKNTKNYTNHTDFSISFFSDFLIDKINALNANVLLIGNSLGGHLALEIAELINNLKGIVIFGTPPLQKPLNLEEAFLPIEALQTFFTENPSDHHIENAISYAIQNKTIKDILINDFKNTNPLVRSSLANDIGLGNLKNEYVIYKNLNVPKFIISGDFDPTVNKDYLKQLNTDSGNSEFFEIQNCGHYPSIEQPEEFNNLILKISKKVFT